jgi:hypothetical protein
MFNVALLIILNSIQLYNCFSVVHSSEEINIIEASNISRYLTYHTSVELVSKRNIIINSEIIWNYLPKKGFKKSTLILIAENNIIFTNLSNIICDGGELIIKAGLNGFGTVIFDWPKNYKGIYAINDCQVNIYYNPSQKGECKYHNPINYHNNIEPVSAETSYMWIHDADDLNNIVCFMSKNYALSKNITVTSTIFEPLYILKPIRRTFAGKFDGNGFSINNLNIYMPDMDDVGLFGIITGHSPDRLSKIKNVILNNCTVHGNNRVGALAGSSIYTEISNIILENVIIKGNSIVGGISGTLEHSILNECTTLNVTLNNTGNYTGAIIAVVVDSLINHKINLSHIGYIDDSMIFI